MESKKISKSLDSFILSLLFRSRLSRIQPPDPLPSLWNLGSFGLEATINGREVDFWNIWEMGKGRVDFERYFVHERGRRCLPELNVRQETTLASHKLLKVSDSDQKRKTFASKLRPADKRAIQCRLHYRLFSKLQWMRNPFGWLNRLVGGFGFSGATEVWEMITLSTITYLRGRWIVKTADGTEQNGFIVQGDRKLRKEKGDFSFLSHNYKNKVSSWAATALASGQYEGKGNVFIWVLPYSFMNLWRYWKMRNTP